MSASSVNRVTNDSAVTVVIDAGSHENRRLVTWAERLEHVQKAEEPWGDLPEFQEGVYIDDRSKDLLCNVLCYNVFEPLSERFQILFLERKAGSVSMATEVFQKVSAALDGIVEVETCDTSCGS